MAQRRVYVASSWKNLELPVVTVHLRQAGHLVFNYHTNGLSWPGIGPRWHDWTACAYIEALKHPRTVEGFDNDYSGMKWADTGLLLLPSGRSAYLALGWMAGSGKRTIILTKGGEAPEPMALLADKICTTVEEVLEALA